MKKREVTINIIENKTNVNKLAEYFANKYSEINSHKLNQNNNKLQKMGTS